MATILPDNRGDQIRKLAALIPVWEEEAGAIGLSGAQVDELKEALALAQRAQVAAVEARLAAQAATDAFHDAAARLRRGAGGAINTIKSYAQSRPTPQEAGAVLIAAQIPAPLPPSTIGAADIPPVTNLDADPDSWGRVTLSWACRGAPAGTVYRIERRLTGEGDGGDGTGQTGSFMLVGVAGGPGAGRRRNTWTDEMIPEGTVTAEYRVTPQRGCGPAVGTGAVAVVRFGTVRGVKEVAALDQHRHSRSARALTPAAGPRTAA